MLKSNILPEIFPIKSSQQCVDELIVVGSVKYHLNSLKELNTDNAYKFFHPISISTVLAVLHINCLTRILYLSKQRYLLKNDYQVSFGHHNIVMYTEK